MPSINKMIYLDNAATSHPKPETVYQAMQEALRSGGSPGRGTHQQSLAAERLVFETREQLADLFNVRNSARFIFTPNATTAINLALFGLLQPGERVVTTTIEHNAVVRSLQELQNRGVEVIKVPADSVTGLVAVADLQKACLSKPTRLLLLNHCSNVIGSIQPISGLGRWCKKQGIVFMLDGAQSAGSLPVDLEALDVDLFAAPGHKGLLGPQGTGFLYIKEGIELHPLIYGGTGANSGSVQQPVELPERLESGTVNLPGIAGLHAALQFLQQTGIEQIRAWEAELTKKLLIGLEKIENVTLYGAAAERIGVISFNLRGYDPAEVGYTLDQKEHISVRVGLHCAPDAHRTIGTYPAGTVRVSPGYFTTCAEIDHFLQAIQKLKNNR